MEEFIGKKIKVIHINNGDNDLTHGKDAERWDGYVGICEHADPMDIRLEGMSIAILPDCDEYEILD